MPQTTEALSMKDAVVEISTDGGTTWLDISGFATAVNPEPGSRATGEANTFAGDVPLTTGGKRSASSVTVSVVYNEIPTEYVTLYDAYKNGTRVSVRWSPKGAQSGDYRWFMNNAIVESAFAPGGEAGSGDPIAGDIQFFGAEIDYEVIV